MWMPRRIEKAGEHAASETKHHIMIVLVRTESLVRGKRRNEGGDVHSHSVAILYQEVFYIEC